MLGIVIGVAAVIAMVAIGSGARNLVDKQIRSLGANALPDAQVERVDLLGGGELQFRRDADALRVTLPPAGGAFVPALRINGLGLT